jgi:hypothetical protein
MELSNHSRCRVNAIAIEKRRHQVANYRAAEPRVTPEYLDEEPAQDSVSARCALGRIDRDRRSAWSKLPLRRARARPRDERRRLLLVGPHRADDAPRARDRRGQRAAPARDRRGAGAARRDPQAARSSDPRAAAERVCNRAKSAARRGGGDRRHRAAPERARAASGAGARARPHQKSGRLGGDDRCGDRRCRDLPRAHRAICRYFRARRRGAR